MGTSALTMCESTLRGCNREERPNINAIFRMLDPITFQRAIPP